MPSARPLCAASVAGHRLSLGKAGRDGTGKATLVRAPASVCWGVVYALSASDWRLLDACEPGYTRDALVVTSVAHVRLEVQSYFAPETAPEPVATRRYLRFIVEGAREHGLPDAWVAALERLPVRPDPAALS